MNNKKAPEKSGAFPFKEGDQVYWSRHGDACIYTLSQFTETHCTVSWDEFEDDPAGYTTVPWESVLEHARKISPLELELL